MFHFLGRWRAYAPTSFARQLTRSKGPNMNALMRELDEQYRALSGLTERRHYSIFYSRIDPSPIMILGINPGGDPTLPSDQYPDREFVGWHHDYVDCDYDIQRAMLPFLKHALKADDALVRRVPKTNVAFRRSTGVDALGKQQHITYDAASKEAEPVLRRIIQNVEPKVIIFEGNQAFEQFVYRYCSNARGEQLCEPVKTPNGRYDATILAACRVQPDMLSHDILAITLGHPSRFGNRREFVAMGDTVAVLLAAPAIELRSLGNPVEAR